MGKVCLGDQSDIALAPVETQTFLLLRGLGSAFDVAGHESGVGFLVLPGRASNVGGTLGSGHTGAGHL